LPDSNDDDVGGKVIWLTDPGADPEIAGPVAVELEELGDLVTEALSRLGQVAVTGVVHRMEGLSVELTEDATPAGDASRLVVLLEAPAEAEVAVGDSVTAVGWLRHQDGGVVLADSELCPPLGRPNSPRPLG
jgi:hypothetical protein